MSFIKVNLDNATEPTVAPNGRYELQITQASEQQSKNGNPMLKISLGFVGNHEYQNVTHFVNLPTENDEPDAMNFKMLLLKRLLAHFRVPYNSEGIDTEKLCMDLLGATAETEVKQTERDGTTYNILYLPRIKEEAGRAESIARKRRA